LFNDGGAMTVDNTVVVGNTATEGSGSGGGLFNNGGTLELDVTLVEGNTSNRAGGGLEAVAGMTTVRVSSLLGNSTGSVPGNGGAMHLSGAGQVDFENSEIAFNTAAAEGGGLWNSGAGTFSVTNCLVSDNDAAGNDADQGGGGLFNDGGTMSILGCTVSGNDASGASGSGGGIMNNMGNLTLSSSQVISNRSQRAGGGLEANAGMTTVEISTFYFNVTGASPGNGAGIHLTGAGMVQIDFARFQRNFAMAEGGGIWNSSTGTIIANNIAFALNVSPIKPDAFNDGGTFTLDGVPVPVGP